MGRLGKVFSVFPIPSQLFGSEFRPTVARASFSFVAESSAAYTRCLRF